MSEYTYNLEGKGKLSNAELIIASNEVYDILRGLPTPKDAAPVLLYAHMSFIKAAFPPEKRTDALLSIDCYVKLLKEFINEGWQ